MSEHNSVSHLSHSNEFKNKNSMFNPIKAMNQMQAETWNQKFPKISKSIIDDYRDPSSDSAFDSNLSHAKKKSFMVRNSIHEISNEQPIAID